MGIGEVYTGFWWGFFRERDFLEGLGVDERIISKLTFKKWNGAHGLVWVSVGTDGGLL
jgi:hypothetical protein